MAIYKKSYFLTATALLEALSKQEEVEEKNESLGFVGPLKSEGFGECV